VVSAKKRVLAFTEANSISPMDLTGKIYFYPGAIKLAEAGSFGSPAARCAVRMGTEAGGAHRIYMAAKIGGRAGTRDELPRAASLPLGRKPFCHQRSSPAGRWQAPATALLTVRA